MEWRFGWWILVLGRQILLLWAIKHLHSKLEFYHGKHFNERSSQHELVLDMRSQITTWLAPRRWGSLSDGADADVHVFTMMV